MSDSELETEYELESFNICGFELQITTVAYLPIELLLKNRMNNIEISGQKLWCGSLGVIQYIYTHNSLINEPSTTIVELGAGTGILGMISKKLNMNNEVIITDHDSISLKHMHEDLKRNQLDSIIIKHLDWYQPNIYELNINSEANNIIIVAGDVLYKHALIDPFFNTVQLIFNKYDTNLINVKMILCHIPRANVSHEDIIQKVIDIGYDIIEISKVEWNTGDCYRYCELDDLNRAKLYQITNKKLS